MKRQHLLGFAIAQCLFAASFGALAVQVPPQADAHISQSRPEVNFGNLPTLNIGPNGMAYVRFDLYSLPPGLAADQLARAVLRVWVNKLSPAGRLTVSGLAGDWSEAALTAANNRLLPGPAEAQVQILAGLAGRYLEIDLTRALQNWLAAAAPDRLFGLALEFAPANPADQNNTLFLDSKENAATSHGPALEIVLNGPAGAAGKNGLDCWDANGNGKKDAGEDANADGKWDGLDCRGPKGDTGAAGATGAQGQKGEKGDPGSNGTNGTDGISGLNCWDVNGNGLGDANEDTNGDRNVDVLDCKGAPGKDGNVGVGISSCQVCFKYAATAEGVGQCNSGNPPSGTLCAPVDSWTPDFIVDTDNRAGGCRMQWKLDCTPPYGDSSSPPPPDTPVDPPILP